MEMMPKKQIFSNTDILFTKETNINLFESAISDIRIQRPSRTHGKRNNLKSSLAAKIEIRKKNTWLTIHATSNINEYGRS